MAIPTSPYKLTTDSPSRQLLWELSQLAISSQQRFYAHLDHENDEREVEHKRALNEAAAEHDRVRRSAEQFREQLELQVQAERRRKEEEAQKELERQRQEKQAEEEAVRERELERARIAKLDAKKVAEARKAELEATEKQRHEKEQSDAEAARPLQEDQSRRLQEKKQAAAAEVRARQAAIQAQNVPPTAEAQSPLPPPPQLSPPISSIYEAEHVRYKEIHRSLKELRKHMNVQAKQIPALKNAMGEMRREIKKSVGQVREGRGKGKNTKQVRLVSSILCAG